YRFFSLFSVIGAYTALHSFPTRRSSDLRPGAVCQQTPPHDTCGGAIDLDPTLSVQTLVGSTRCARDDGQAFFECGWDGVADVFRSEEHTSELQSRENLVCRLLLEKKKIR